jgi:hypothetical protein
MLRESEPYRRRHRDNAQIFRGKWLEYERRKRRLADTAESADEYEAGIRRICDDLGV